MVLQGPGSFGPYRSLKMAANQYMVGARGSMVVVANSPCHRGMTREEALNLAAWLVAICEALPRPVPGPTTVERFHELLEQAESGA